MSQPVATFSLVALDPDSGDLGVAVASKFLAVGAVVPYAKAGVGAVATQSYVNSTFGPKGLAYLAQGQSPEVCLERFRRGDSEFASRQFGMVAADGTSVTFTGDACHTWAGGVSGPGYAAQGNILTGSEVVEALVDSYTSRQGLGLPERLLSALAAADEAGGDRRGRQSAAVLVVGEGKGYAGYNDRWIDLRVDDHPDPVTELGRLLELHRLYFGKSSHPPYEPSRDDIAWLQGVLADKNLLDQQPDGEWSEATEQALRGLYGIENLEERWLDGGKLDPVAWAYLQETFGERSWLT